MGIPEFADALAQLSMLHLPSVPCVQVKDALLGLAVQLAVFSWPAGGDAALAVGALELAVLCGLKPQPQNPCFAGHAGRRQARDASAAAAEQLVLLQLQVAAGWQMAEEGSGAAPAAGAAAEGETERHRHRQLLAAQLRRLLPQERAHVTFAPLPEVEAD